MVCPRCHGPVTREPESYRCDPCDETYPVVCGIPDFRIAPDPWLGLDEDRAKARRLAELTRGIDFEASVRTYWEITPDTPRDLARRYIRHVLAARARSDEWLAGLSPADETAWLDLGCGTGDGLAALSARGRQAVGVDIALRWLVIARRRAELRGDGVALICCCAEALPFPREAFGRVVALGLFEHCAAPEPVCREARRVLATGGRFDTRTVNRYSVLGEPHVGVWGAGFVPRGLADRYVRWRAGIRYQHHRPLSPRDLRRAMKRAGFSSVRVGAARVLPAERERLGGLGRAAAALYAGLRVVPVARRALAWGAPLLEASGRVA